MTTATTVQPLIERPRSQTLVQLPVVWLLICALVFFAARGEFSFQDLDLADALSANASSSVGTIGGVLAYLLVTTLVAFKLRRIMAVALQMKWMTLLALLAVGSTIWSQSPSRSFLYGSCYLLSTLFAYYLVLRFDDDQLMELVTLTGAAVSVLCVIFVVALPQYGISYRDPRSPGAWVGIFPARTGVAQVLTFLLTPALILRDSRRHWRQLAYVLLVVFLILMSRPVTALILMCLYAGSVAWLYLLRITKRRTAWSIGFAVISVLMLLVILVVPQMPLLFGLFGRDATISGRTVIWQGLLESFAKRPLLGYGYSAFWQGLNGESAKAILGAHWIFAYAHNGLLEIMLQVGLVGLIIFFITLIKAFKDGWFCLAHGQTPGVEWCVGLLLLTCMYNIDEETLLFPKDLLSILYIVACTSLARHAARLKSDLNRNHGQNTGYLYSE